ncbi:eukaryotic translation initiation factor 4B3-like [Asparagus officinalis]|uniref:eukaryotic translation initiation factor 4B3-like n=1 Tax=Asparagus officinalis TaxID=4686 RepID=UPI00098E2CFB|nr:eukaryotic translation initiation factor 4B3-like [Asparagus officinalis]
MGCGYSSSDSADFPSLSAAAVTKIPKKKKKQTLTLAEYTSGTAVNPGAGKFQPPSRALTLTPDELLALPTGPRERSEEELQRSRGFGYRGGPSRVSGDENPRRGPPREPRDLGPSRADEVDDWGSTKKAPVGFERRERDRGFFDSQSRADESDSWTSKKGTLPPANEARGERRGFDFRKERSNGNGVDSDSWGKKREENGGSSRPRLVLQPRTLPVVNGVNGEEEKEVEVKSKGSNPFGAARPREEVLKEKGKDWKEIDEKLEAVKIREPKGNAWRKEVGVGNGLKEERTERTWRKPEACDATSPAPSVDAVEEQLQEN